MFLRSFSEVCGSCAVVDSFAPGVERIPAVVEFRSSLICKVLSLKVSSDSFKGANWPLMVVASCVRVIMCS